MLNTPFVKLNKANNMLPCKYRVSFDVVTDEPAEHGDTAASGWCNAENGLYDLREAIDELYRAGNPDECYAHQWSGCVDGYTFITCSVSQTITVQHNANWQTGEHVSKTLHLDHVSASSFQRIAAIAHKYW